MNLNLTIRRQWWIWVFVLFILLTALSVILTIRAIIQDYPPYRLSGHLTEVPLEQRAALVLGAKTKDNVMSNALRARVSRIGMVGPLATIALSVLLLDEKFTLWLLAGTSLVLLGIYITNRRRA